MIAARILTGELSDITLFRAMAPNGISLVGRNSTEYIRFWSSDGLDLDAMEVDILWTIDLDGFIRTVRRNSVEPISDHLISDRPKTSVSNQGRGDRRDRWLELGSFDRIV